MTDSEKLLIIKLSEIIIKLNEPDKRYLLGVADGMSISNLNNEPLKLISEKQNEN